MARPEVTGRRVAHSIIEAMQESGLGRDSLYKAIRAGKLDARKAGRRTIILNLYEYLEALPRMTAAEDKAAS